MQAEILYYMDRVKYEVVAEGEEECGGSGWGVYGQCFVLRVVYSEHCILWTRVFYFNILDAFEAILMIILGIPDTYLSSRLRELHKPQERSNTLPCFSSHPPSPRLRSHCELTHPPHFCSRRKRRCSVQPGRDTACTLSLAKTLWPFPNAKPAPICIDCPPIRLPQPHPHSHIQHLRLLLMTPIPTPGLPPRLLKIMPRWTHLVLLEDLPALRKRYTTVVGISRGVGSRDVSAGDINFRVDVGAGEEAWAGQGGVFCKDLWRGFMSKV
jgi:hypothetical protein